MTDKEIEILPVYYDWLIEKKYPVNVLVGGRNSGKSYVMEQLAVINLHNSEDYTLLVIEDIETNIGAGVKNGIEKRSEEFGIDLLFRSTKVPPEIHHLNGNKVLFKGYRTEDQQKQVKSLNEITAAWYEEAENITYNQFKALRMQLRGGRPEDRQLFLTLNPINEAGFVNQYFFRRAPDKVFEYFPDGRPKVFEVSIDVELEDGDFCLPCLVVCTTYKDNPYLTNEQKADIEELKDIDSDMYDMLALCKFVKPQGAFFKEFQVGVHTCRAFPVPRHWRRYRAFDYGLDKLACYWIAIDDNGRAYVYKELYESDLIISRAAEKIQQMTLPSEYIYETLAPPDLWNRRQETGKSAAEIFADNGIWLTRAANNREQGWLDLKEWLKVYDNEDIKQADLVIFDNCTNLIRTMQAVQKDRANPNDIDSRTDHELTHAPDALRYFVAGRPAPRWQAPAEPVYNFEIEKPVREPDHEDYIYI